MATKKYNPRSSGTKPKTAPMAKAEPTSSELLTDLRQLILDARQKVAHEIRSTLMMFPNQDLLGDSKPTPDLVFKDPYFLDFLGLKNAYPAKNFEDAILREMAQFLLEMGAGFAFVERQKRIVIDDEDFYLDLLFYHRKLKRLVLIELKLDTFKAADFGQTSLYLRWLDKYERHPGEEAPIGLILCAGKSDERIELLEIEKSGIRVAEYMTELPSKEALQQRLHKAIEQARAKFLEARAKEDNGSRTTD